MPKNAIKTFKEFFNEETDKKILADAERIYETLRTPSAIKKFRKASIEEQDALVPTIDNDYSIAFWNGIIDMALAYSLYVTEHLSPDELRKFNNAPIKFTPADFKYLLRKQDFAKTPSGNYTEEHKKNLAETLLALFKQGNLHTEPYWVSDHDWDGLVGADDKGIAEWEEVIDNEGEQLCVVDINTPGKVIVISNDIYPHVRLELGKKHSSELYDVIQKYVVAHKKMREERDKIELDDLEAVTENLQYKEDEKDTLNFSDKVIKSHKSKTKKIQSATNKFKCKNVSGVVIADEIANMKRSGVVKGDITPAKGKKLKEQIVKTMTVKGRR